MNAMQFALVSVGFIRPLKTPNNADCTKNVHAGRFACSFIAIYKCFPRQAHPHNILPPCITLGLG
jgi:hypothetical protein